MRFNVTIIRPLGFMHSSAFREIQQSLTWSLSELGHEVMESENTIGANWTNIVLGAELLGPASTLPLDTIIYNLEQPSHPNLPIVRKLAKGLTVWDYSKRNVEQWKKDGFDVHHVPVGFTPNLVRIPKSDHYDYDVAFFGWMTSRRQKIIDDLKSAGLRVFNSDCCYGGARDSIISRSRVVLNIHHDGRDRFEIVRVSYLLANEILVVSEKSSDDDEYKDLSSGIEVTDDVVKSCREIVEARSKWDGMGYGAMEHNGAHCIEDRDFTATLRNTLLEMRYRRGCREGDMKDFLPWLREQARGKVVLEIGVRDGASTSAMLPVANFLYSVDIEDCSMVARGHPYWQFIHGNSHENGICTPYQMVLVDGDHTREGVKHDLESHWNYLVPGGIMACHDIRPEPGMTLEDHPGSDLPSIAVREEFYAFAQRYNLPVVELPGKFGMGYVVKP